MGAAGRERVLSEFGWPAIAQKTVEVYSAVLAATGLTGRAATFLPAGPCAGDATAAKSGATPALSRNCDGRSDGLSQIACPVSCHRPSR